MINVLSSALGAVSAVYPKELISVENSTITYSKGYPVESISSEKTYSFIMPLQDDERAIYSESILEATKLRKFYILTKDGNRVLISKEITPKQTKIKRADNSVYEVFAVNDRVDDGFICVFGALVESESEGE